MSFFSSCLLSLISFGFIPLIVELFCPSIPFIILSFDAALNSFLSSNCYVFKVWARIWTVLANHFISAGSHHDEKIAMYAIDSLRQLSIKYLERAELAKFSFQNDILKPFVVLMRNSPSESKRRLIVDCIVQVL